MAKSIWHSIANLFANLDPGKVIFIITIVFGLSIFISTVIGTITGSHSSNNSTNLVGGGTTSSSSSSNDHTIKFEVTGITGSLNASSLVVVHYECIKYCMAHTSMTSDRNNCFAQCALLGKEGCNVTK